MNRPHRLGIDVGGTFTDLALAHGETGEVMSEKVLTSPLEPWIGIRQGILQLSARGVDVASIGTVVHGTTLVINALIERRGARVGLITTRGFRDILYFGRELRYDIYDPDMTLPEPLVPRHLRREVTERVSGDGSTIEPLDHQEATEVVAELLAAGVESFAVCFLHSYLRPDHELAMRELIEQAAPGSPVSLSHEVLPQIREYERCSATAINAYVQPLVGRYLTQLQAGLEEMGCSATLYLMTSSGGTMTVDTALAFPIQMAESGPAAGALIASKVAATAQLKDIVAFDMGGTTAKSCLIRGGRPLINKNYEVARIRRYVKGSGLPVGIPVVDLLEIGAGGGSVAEVDAMGLLRVGPRSVGADPGPACYCRGGTEATVTDANVVLGLIRPEAFLGGSMLLDKDAALKAVADNVAKPLGMEVEEAAVAIHRVVTENMAEAARVHAVEMNVDVRGMGMVAFGGAGPIHAPGIAQRLDVPFVLCPREAGVLSAWGLLSAPMAFEFVRSWARDLWDLDIDQVNQLLGKLRHDAETLLGKAGVTSPHLEYSVDMCYSGQRYEVTTSLASSVLTADGLQGLKEVFDTTYEAAYGRRLDQLPARCMTWRVLASGPAPNSLLLDRPTSRPRTGSSSVTRSVIFPDHGAMACAIYEGRSLQPGTRLIGPAVIEEFATTIVIPPGSEAAMDAWGNAVITPRVTASPGERRAAG